MLLALIIVAVVVVGGILIAGSARNAPNGYEDETGFHEGKEP